MASLGGALKWVVLGREDGLRARLRRRLGQCMAPSATPEPDGSSAPAPRSATGVTVGGASPLEPPRDVTPPDGFEVVLHKNGLAPGEITEVIVAGTAIAIANVAGSYFAIANTCVHAGGPLGDGTLQGHTVTCPYHGWTYDVRTGQCGVDDDARVASYPVEVVGDAVCVRL